MEKFEASVEVRQPVDKVFAFATDLDNNVHWQTGFLESEIISGGSMEVGTTFRCVNEFLSQRVETQGVVTEYEPNKKCSYQVVSGPIQANNSFIFEPIEGGTKITTLAQADLKAFRFTKAIVAYQARKQIEKDLTTLKNVLETGI
ncbi:MAG: SRPBCC family protein [Desulfobacterales bacterium]|nr:SRPBCC family protein [Desulfobacterales bacterium]